MRLFFQADVQAVEQVGQGGDHRQTKAVVGNACAGDQARLHGDGMVGTVGVDRVHVCRYGNIAFCPRFHAKHRKYSISRRFQHSADRLH